MGKLSVLGAQRIKALEGMLDDKYKDELLALEKSLEKIDASKEARKTVGIDSDFERAMELIKVANELLRNVSAVTGDTHTASYSHSSNYRAKTKYKEIRDELSEKHNGKKEKEEIKAKYARKKQMLWLCETLEEAKEIVGIE